MFSFGLNAIFYISYFGFEDRILVPIVPVPGHCLHLAFV